MDSCVGVDFHHSYRSNESNIDISVLKRCCTPQQKAPWRLSVSQNRLIEAIQALKNVPRTGWLYAGISMPEVESVAEHSYGVAMLSVLTAEAFVDKGEKVDLARTLKMALLHDLSESLTFDISKKYLEFLGKEKGARSKQRFEEAASQKLLSELPYRTKKEVLQILQEHKLGKTLEARIVTIADRLDLLLQLGAYRRSGYRDPKLSDMENKVIEEIRSTRNPVFLNFLQMIRSESG